MKRIILIMITAFLLIGYSCQPKVDTEKEKEAIVSIINAEKEGYIAKDMEKMAATIDHDNYVWMYSGADQYIVNHGFTEQQKMLEKWWSNVNPYIKNESYSIENMDIKVFPSCAWAELNVKFSYEDYGKPQEKYSVETMFFEKKEAGWKIVGHTVIGVSTYSKK